MIVGIVQARMGSSRLPGKVMKPMGGKPMLERLLERLSNSESLDKIYVATSTQAREEPIVELCSTMNVACWRGSEDDTLSRFIQIINIESPDTVVRLTGDNPLIDGAFVDDAIKEFKAQKLDYLNTLDHSNYPKGLTVEVVRAECLTAAAQSTDMTDHEHVTQFVRNRPDRFRLGILRDDVKFPDMELTVDTPLDFRKVAFIFDKMNRYGEHVDMRILAQLCWDHFDEISAIELK